MRRMGWRQCAVAVMSMLLSGPAPGVGAASELPGQAEIEEFVPQGRVSAVKAVQLRMSASIRRLLVAIFRPASHCVAEHGRTRP